MPVLPRRPRAVARVAASLSLLALLVHVAHTATGWGGERVDALVDGWLYHGLMLGAAAACLARGALVATDRAPWLLIGAGATAWSLGDLHYSLALAELAEPPFPSLSDALFLSWYPACCAALALLVRAHVREFGRSLGVDAVTGALAVGAVAAAVLYDAIAVTIGGDALAVAATLA